MRWPAPFAGPARRNGSPSCVPIPTGNSSTDSTAEQASAGLDALTDAERAFFTALNADYTEKHGFPFIIAVRDHDKAGILAAFETRLANDTETEFATACAQVERIARLRLESLA